ALYQVRNQAGPPLELHFDPAPGFARAIARAHQVVIAEHYGEKTKRGHGQWDQSAHRRPGVERDEPEIHVDLLGVPVPDYVRAYGENISLIALVIAAAPTLGRLCSKPALVRRRSIDRGDLGVVQP